jgi:hypothetical protein
VAAERSLALASVVAVGIVGGLVAILAGGRDSSRAATQHALHAPPPPTRPQVTAAAHGTDYYVSPSGTDGARGSRTQPWRTLRYAATRVSPGATVHVAPGHYPGRLTIARGGTARRPVRFVSERLWQARIDATSTGRMRVVEIRGDHVTFEGFDVTGGGSDGSAGISADGAEDAILSNHVHDMAIPCLQGGGNGGAGIAVSGDNYHRRGGLVDGNLLERIGIPPSSGHCSLVHGIYASIPRVTVSNNIIFEAAADGITSWHAASALTIVNNLSMLNGGSGILVGSGEAGATRRGNVDTLVANNIVYRNTSAGITEDSDGRHPVGPGNRYLHNIAFANGGAAGASAAGVTGLSGSALVAETLNVDPQLVPVGPGAPRGYALSGTSPAVDAGTAVGAPRRDFDGTSRPQGRAVDIGPYESPASPR